MLAGADQQLEALFEKYDQRLIAKLWARSVAS